MVVIGEEEIREGIVKGEWMGEGVSENKEELEVLADSLAEFLVLPVNK